MAGWLPAVLALAVVAQPRPVDPLARLSTWLAAVDRHQPGNADAPALEIGNWPRAELLELAADLGIFLDRLDEARPIASSRRSIPQASRRRPPNVVDAIRGRAAAVLREGNSNLVLKRGALLQADVASLVPLGRSAFAPPALSASPLNRRRPSGGSVVVQTEDGVVLDLEHGTLHWEIGRMLLGSVSPDPARDEFVRSWYGVTTAYMVWKEQLAYAFPHVHVGLRLLGGDARLLFYDGALHETFASPAVQAASRALESRVDMKSDVQSVEAELDLAEKSFRKALEADPNFAEARLRLGRVLGLQGRHEEAAAQLRQAIPQLRDSQLEYYGELFLGHEEAAMRRPQPAREHFDRAAVLYPRAQSPRLALALLARSHGDRPAALLAAREVFAFPTEEKEREDPWWEYHKSHVRNTDVLLAELHRSVLTEGKR